MLYRKKNAFFLIKGLGIIQLNVFNKLQFSLF